MSNDYNGKKRSELPDSVFGIPQERKYPMPDEKHTRSAIKLFNHVEPKYEEQLAKAVIKNMKKYGIDGSAVGPNNRLRKYLPEDMIKESMDSLLYEYMYTDNDLDIIIQESGYALTWRIMPILLKAALSGVDQYDYKYLREKKLPAILKKCKTMDDIKYMRRDAITAKTQLEILKRNVHAVNTNDENIMKRLNKSFVKKVKDGKITEKEIDTHIRWLGIEYKKLIDARAKEIKDSIKESSMLEGYLKSDKDIYYNKDRFDSGEINLCFITGLSGSGKSTMGRGMSSKDVEHYEMDDVICNDNFSDNNLKEYGGLIESFFKGSGKSFRLKRDDDNHNDSVFKSHKNYEKEITQAFVKHAISYCKSHKGIKYVCDGIWIFMFIKPEQLKDCAVYIKGTSSIKSGYRALRRDIDEDKRNGMSSLQIFKHEFKRIKEDVLYARENQKELRSFRSYFEKQSTNESVSILPQDTGISTVIFDIGDVLVSANIRDYLVADPEVPNEIVDELLKLWFIDKDEVDDTMDLDTYREIVNKRMGVEFSKYIPKLFKYNVECVTTFDYTIPMIQDLKDKGYKVYYLSNWSAWTHDLLQEAGKFDFLKLMDGGVFSYDVGYMKPDEEIYKILLNKYKINPEEAIFFDDREENIEAANKLGIHGIHFPRHDASIVYNNLYGRKLAKAIYEDMDNFRYDFDHSYNDKVFGIPSIQEYGTTGGTIVRANQPLYFYHMVDSGANLSKGLLSLGYMYHHSKPLFLKNASKYRNRLCNGWDIYPGRDPKSLTAEEIYEGIKKFRNEDNLNSIYFFKYPPYSSLDKRFDRLYKYKKLYRININDTKVKSIIKNINYGWVDSNTYNDPLDRKYYETISPEDYFNNFDPDKGLLFSTLYHISIEVKNGYIPMRLLEEVKVPNTIEDIISMEESSIQEYGTTGGTIVGANQPDSVYIVNYMQNNVFSGYKEPKQAICKKGMNQMYTTKNGKAVPVDKDKFKEEASDISVFRFKETPILSFDKIIENASVDGDFYMLLTGDYPTNQHEIEYDNRFVQEENFLDELDDITCCTESTITGQIETSNYPYMKVLTESVQGRCWNYYRDINGVFAMNELTGLRTPSYENAIDIPKSQIKLIERGTVYLGK